MKKHSITQKLNLGGQTESRSIILNATEAEVTTFIAGLEGKVTVKVELPDLTVGNDETLVEKSNAKFVSNIKSTFKTASGTRINAYTSAFGNKTMIFKSTLSKTEIENLLLTTPLLLEFPTLKPASVDADIGGTYAPAE